jgi:hypothetical protein
MFDLLDAFSCEPNIDPDEVRHLQRNWIRRILSTLQPWKWPDTSRSWLPALSLQADPQAVLLAGTVDVSRKILRCIK